DFPLATEPRIRWSCTETSDTQGNYTSRAAAGHKALRAGGAISAKETVVGRAAIPGCKYRLDLASGSVELDTRQPEIEHSVHFLDVAHVRLTHQDGTVRDVAGKIRLSLIPGPGQAAKALSDFDYD